MRSRPNIGSNYPTSWILVPSPTSSICKREAFPVNWISHEESYTVLCQSMNQSNWDMRYTAVDWQGQYTQPFTGFNTGLERKRKKEERGGAASKPSWWTQLSCACNIKQGEHLEGSIMIINRAISRTACALKMVQSPNKVFRIEQWRLGAIFLVSNKSQWVFIIEWHHWRCEKSLCPLTLHVCSDICS